MTVKQLSVCNPNPHHQNVLGVLLAMVGMIWYSWLKIPPTAKPPPVWSASPGPEAEEEEVVIEPRNRKD